MEERSEYILAVRPVDDLPPPLEDGVCLWYVGWPEVEKEPLLGDGEYVERFREALDGLGGSEAGEEGCRCRVLKALLAELSCAASRDVAT